MSSRTSTTSITIIKQKNGAMPSVLVNSSVSTSKQPTLSKNNTNVKVLRNNKKSHQNKQQQQQQQQQQKSNKTASSNNNSNNATKKACVSAPATPQQRRTVLPVKARRVERRKEIVSMTEAIKIDIDTPSSTESDDSSSSSSGKKTAQKKNNTNKQQHKKAMPTTIHATTSTIIISAESTKKREEQRNRRRSSSAIDIRQSHVYAGPTFNNAPAPSALPIPAFSPTLLSVNLINTIDGKDDLQRHSKDIMNLLSPKPRHHEFDSDLSEIQRGLRSMLKI